MPVSELQTNFFMQDGLGGYVSIETEDDDINLTSYTYTTFLSGIIWNPDYDFKLDCINNYRKFHGKPLFRGGKLKRIREMKGEEQ